MHPRSFILESRLDPWPVHDSQGVTSFLGSPFAHVHTQLKTDERPLGTLMQMPGVIDVPVHGAESDTSEEGATGEWDLVIRPLPRGSSAQRFRNVRDCAFTAR